MNPTKWPLEVTVDTSDPSNGEVNRCVTHKLLFKTAAVSTRVMAIPTVPLMMISICNKCAACLDANPSIRSELFDMMKAAHKKRLDDLVTAGFNNDP